MPPYRTIPSNEEPKLILPECILTRAKSADNCNARFPQKNAKDGLFAHPQLIIY